MFAALLKLALAAAAVQLVSAFAVNNPTLKQCASSQISWEATKGSYNVVVVDAAKPCDDTPLVDLGDITKTTTSWTVNIPAGTVVQINVVDSEDGEAWSQNLTVAESTDSSCLTATNNLTGGSPTPDKTDKTDGTDDTGIEAVGGAANAATFPISAASSTAQISMPVLAIAGLVATFALSL